MCDENQGELNVDERVEQKCVSVMGCVECCVCRWCDMRLDERQWPGGDGEGSER